MGNHIIEYIGKSGVRTTPMEIRMTRVRAGDIIEVPEELRKYPISYRHCRIATIEDGVAMIVDGMGSAFLLENGACSISGGPFFSVPVQFLKPKNELHTATYWNWGDNLPGADRGVNYHIQRPVHTLTDHPDNFKYRWSVDENSARRGKFLNDAFLEVKEWNLVMMSENIHGGERQYVFHKTN
jgi:hypothetical protein